MMVDYPGTSVSGRRSGLDRREFVNPNYRGVERRMHPDRRSGVQNRKYQRYRAEYLTFVKLTSGSKVDIGQLMDISRRGLALRYFVSEKRSRQYTELGIFLSGGSLILDQIPFRTVSDTELANEFPYSTIIFRRYAVQFDKLTADKKQKLEHFLLHHTLGLA